MRKIDRKREKDKEGWREIEGWGVTETETEIE